MHSADLINLLPYLLPATGGLVILILSIWPKRVSTRFLSTTALTFLLLGATATLLWQVPGAVGSLLVIDEISRIFTLFFMLGAAAIMLLSFGYAPIRNELHEEYLSLILFATSGMALLVSSNNLVSAFVGLEMLAVPLYALIAWQPTRYGAIEGGIKYAVLASFAAAFFLYGVALAYASGGTLDLAELNTIASSASLLPVAITLILVGVGFKVALAPFHMWAPDIYQAAPSPITALFASLSKAATLVFLIRLLCLQLSLIWEALLPLLWGIALISMIVGNVLALHQRNLKRLLAYSSVAHLGYILVALSAGNSAGRDAAIYYAVTLAIMNLGVFAVIVAFTRRDQDRENLTDYRGLGRRYPVLGIGMGICLLALAGLPPTAGFMAKLFAFGAAIEADNVILAIVAVINTALAFFYYLRVIGVLFSEEETAVGTSPPAQGPLMVIIIAMILVIGLGIFPQWLLALLELP